ncbi:MAG: twin-arginine translocase TatA/TatE family subunit [Deltaproteobacteria bacterium]|nr:twin-arginine translocase TatA/TatE family subunit [Deltaproteobacteria bacterium]
MFGIGGSELIILSIALVIIIGPKQLPTVMQTLGKFVREIMNARSDFMKSIDEDESLRSVKKSYEDVKNAVDSKVKDLKSQIESEVKKVADKEDSSS